MLCWNMEYEKCRNMGSIRDYLWYWKLNYRLTNKWCLKSMLRSHDSHLLLCHIWLIPCESMAYLTASSIVSSRLDYVNVCDLLVPACWVFLSKIRLQYRKSCVLALFILSCNALSCYQDAKACTLQSFYKSNSEVGIPYDYLFLLTYSILSMFCFTLIMSRTVLWTVFM